jgi:hypothetical protein
MLNVNREIVRRKACGKEGTRVEGVERVMTLPCTKSVSEGQEEYKDVL